MFLLLFFLSLTSFSAAAKDSETKKYLNKLYSRNHHKTVQFKVNSQNLNSFMEQEGKRYSLMKYGDAQSIEEYSKMLASQIWNEFGKELLDSPKDWLMVCPSYFKAPTAAVTLAKTTREILVRKHQVDLKIVSMHRKSTNDREFGELKTIEERQSYIVGNFYYKGESLNNKNLIFIEDALVSGTHYLETQKILKEQAGANLDKLHGFFIVEVENENLGDTNYEMEALLNYGWIDGKHLERLLPILKDEKTVYTPRMLKFIFGNSDRTNFYSKQLSFVELNKLYQTAYEENFLEKPKYKDLVENLRTSLSQQLAEKKQTLNLSSVYQLDEPTLDLIMTKKKIDHHLVKGKASLADMYSLLKFGDEHAIELFAHKVADKIKDTLLTTWPLDPQEWGLCTTGYVSVTGAADLLTRKISEIIGIPVIHSKRKESFSGSYGQINSVSERSKAVSGKFYFSAPLRKHMIYIDDAVASGSHVQEYQDLTKSKGAKTFHAFAIFDISSIDNSLENKLNHSMIKTNDGTMLAAILAQEHSPILLRTIKTILNFERRTLKNFVEQIELPTLNRIHTAICAEGYDKKPVFSKTLKYLISRIKDKSGKPKT